MKVLKTIGFWVLQCTWGAVMTVLGAIATLVLILFGKKPQHIGPVVYIRVGTGWGGVNLGGFFICSETADEDTLLHECGHAIQNMIFGPLFPFVIGIPSFIRCWIRVFCSHLGKSLFNLFFLLSALFFTTLCAVMFGPILDGYKALTIIAEVLRLYFLGISIWLSAIEIPKYDKGKVLYDDIWFEGQATELGIKIFKKYL